MNHIGMTRDGGYTSLMMASGSGHADVVRALIEADPSPKKHIQMKVLGYYAYGVRVVDGLGACVCECARVCGRPCSVGVFMHRA